MKFESRIRPVSPTRSLTFHWEGFVVGILLTLTYRRGDRGQAGDLHASVAAYVLLGELHVQLANAEHALLLLRRSHRSRRCCHTAAPARMRQGPLIAGRQLIHRTCVRGYAQLPVVVGRLRSEATAVQGAADDAQSVLVYVATVLAVTVVPANIKRTGVWV